MFGNVSLILLFMLLRHNTPLAVWFWSEIFLVVDGFHIPGRLVAQRFAQFGW